MNRDEQADSPELPELVAQLNRLYGTNVPVDVIRRCVRAGFTSIERMKLDILEDGEPSITTPPGQTPRP